MSRSSSDSGSKRRAREPAADHAWQLKYTPDDGDLVRLFYVPALACAVRYDRLTGYFQASALALAARGVEGLVAQRRPDAAGRRLHARPAEVEAIEQGRGAAQARSSSTCWRCRWRRSDQAMADALELLAWMVADGHSRSEGGGPLRQRAPPDPGGRHLPREGRHHRGQDRRPDRLQRQPQRDRSRLDGATGKASTSSRSGREPDRVDGRGARISRASGPTRHVA